MRVRRVEKLAPQLSVVHDIGVAKNHNFFIRPKGSNESLLVSNCHRLTLPAANALLKSLEDSPKRTLWILATTNPEKLLHTIVGRCLKLNIKTIDPLVIARQLRIISKREGVDLKAMEGGADIVKVIVDLSNGSMRDAISILESALFALKSNKNVDAKSVMNAFLNTGEADLERSAANLLIALLSCDLKAIVQEARTCQNSRGVLTKLRWIIQYSLDNSVGMAKYTPYGAKLFNKAAVSKGIKISLPTLIKIQYLLVEIEVRFNTMSIDESVMFLSMLGNFAIENKR